MKACCYIEKSCDFQGEHEAIDDSYTQPQDRSRIGLETAYPSSRTQCENLSAKHADIIDSRSIIDSMPSAVVVLDHFGQIAYFNEKANDVIGLLSIGEKWRDVIDRCFMLPFNNNEMVSQNGYTLILETAPMPNKKGQILVFHDAGKYNNLTILRERYSKLAALGELAAKLAHQIRTPLAASMLFFSNMKDTLEPSSRSLNNYTKGMQGLRNIEAMIGDMLLFSSDKKNNNEKIKFDDLITVIGNEIDVLSEQYDCIINIEYDKQILVIKGNLYAIKSALINLIENSAQACMAKKHQYLKEDIDYRPVVNISIKKIKEKSKYSICFKVTDNGVGLDNNVIKKCLKPFYTTKQNGTGLGLAVVKSIIDAHEGSIAIQSKKALGATVIVKLP
jgi:two-component system sensor histidine kinase FlrB